MKTNPLQQLTALRRSLVAERDELTARLRELNAALGDESAPAAGAPVAAARRGRKPKALVAAVASVAAPAAKAGARRGRRAKNGLSLKEAVIQVTGKSGLTKAEILSAVAKIGYKFTSKNPANSLGTLLYGKNPKFKNKDGKFSPA